jgi:S1-C subfamily serine protease
MRTLRKGPITQLIAALVGGLIVAAVILAAGLTTKTTTTTLVADIPTGSVASGGLDPRAIYERDAPGVVFVSAKVVDTTDSPFNLFPVQQAGVQSGSGIVINANGTILTNAHVIDGALKITVQLLGGQTVPAQVIGKDPDDDLALLKINPSGLDLVPLPLGNSNTAQVGDPTVAIGNPFNLQRTLTTGVVSALQREIQAPNGYAIDNVIQTDAPINPGNSGGPLINAAGQVIGINSQIATTGSGSDTSVGIGFAIPINTAKLVIPQLERYGKVIEGYLGIETTDVNVSLASLRLPVSSGALVEKVASGTPAAKAGLRGGNANNPVTLPDGITQVVAGGDIIVSLNGQPITSSGQLAHRVELDKPGQLVTLGIVRGSRQLTVKVTLGTRPEDLPSSG